MASNLGRAKVRGITIQLNADAAGLAKELGRVNSLIGQTQKDLRDVDKLLQQDPKNATLLQQKFNLLNKEIEETKTRIEKSKEALEILGKSEATDEVKRQQEALQRQIAADEQQLKSLQGELKEFGNVGKQQALAVAEQFQSFGKQISEVGEKISSAGRSFTMRVSTPIIKGFQSSVESAADFEQAMAQVAAVSLGATEEELAALAEQAMELSNTTKYGADEAAEALYYMGLAGWDVEEMAKALPSVLNVAAAGAVDLGRASDIVTDYITAFGLTADDAAGFVDVMTATMANSNTTVDLLGESFKYVAPVAGALGYSVEDVSLALGIMANNGIKGTQAGTSLRMMMQRMAKPTKEVSDAMEMLGVSLTDDEGNMYSFREVMDQLRKTMGNSAIPADKLAKRIQDLEEALDEGTITEEEYQEAMEAVAGEAYGLTGIEKARAAATIGGVRAMSGMLAITNSTTKDYNDLAKAIDNSKNSAQEMADTMLNTTQGQFQILQNNIKNLSVEIGQTLLPYVQKAVDAIKNIVGWFRNLDDSAKKRIITIAGIVAAIGPLLIILGKLTSSIGGIIGGISGLVKAFISHPILATIGLLAGAIAGLVIKTQLAKKETEEYWNSLYGLEKKQQALIDKSEEYRQAIEQEDEARAEAVQSVINETNEKQSLLSRLHEITDEKGKVLQGYQDEASFITSRLRELTGEEVSLIGDKILGYEKLQQAIQEKINLQYAEGVLSANQASYDAAKSRQAEAYLNYSNSELAIKKEQAELDLLIQEEGERYLKWQEYRQKAIANQFKSGLGGKEFYERLADAAEDAYNQTIENQAKVRENIKNLESAQQQYTETISRDQDLIESYDKANRELLAGNAEGARKAAQQLTWGLKTSSNASLETLRSQYAQTQREYNQLYELEKSGTMKVSAAVLREYRERMQAAERELNIALAGQKEQYVRGAKETAGAMSSTNFMYRNVGVAQMQAVQDGINSKLEEAKRTARNAGQQTANSFGTIDTVSIGTNFVAGIVKGINNNSYRAINAARAVAQDARNKANAVLDIRSPSRVMAETGKYFDLGFAQGIERFSYKVEDASASVARSIIDIGSATTEFSASAQRGVTNNSSINMGGVSVVVNAAQGQSENEIADAVMDRLNRQILMQKAVGIA